MPASLPEYKPPDARCAAVAAGVAPILVLLAFILIISGLIDVETGFAVFAASTVWVVVEMSRFQHAIDCYNEDYVERHLVWRSSATLCEAVTVAPAPTREFVGRFLQAERVLLRDGQLP